jgi:hypothetical protein
MAGADPGLRFLVWGQCPVIVWKWYTSHFKGECHEILIFKIVCFVKSSSFISLFSANLLIVSFWQNFRIFYLCNAGHQNINYIYINVIV